MKFLSIFISVFILLGYNYAQRFEFEKKCDGDTVQVEVFKGGKEGRIRYKAESCQRPSRLGVRLETGAATYSYAPSVTNWIGNTPTISYGLGGAFKRLNFGFRWKPQVVNPKIEILMGDDVLYNSARIRSVKYDFYVSYSFDFKNLVSLEPYLGWTDNRFSVRNQSILAKSYEIPVASGFMGGITLNRYFHMGSYEYFAVFIRAGYSGSDYSRTHPTLDKGFWEAAFGIAYKGFYRHNFYDRLD